MISDLLKRYEVKKTEIKKRLDEFRKIKDMEDEIIFAELAFCLCTPQSKATTCWNAVQALVKNNLLYSGEKDQIKPFLNAVRFNENKSNYIIEARELFSDGNKLNMKKLIGSSKDPYKLREWLAENINGMGMKESSHFLRNIGIGNGLAILDVHILKNLKRYGVIEDMPKSLNKKKYLEIEDKMKKFAEDVGIQIDELDLLLWSEETGFVFK